jgi:chromosome segregation ATPase
VDEQDLVYRLRKRAEVRIKLDRGNGKLDRISAQLLEAADEIESLRKHTDLLETQLADATNKIDELEDYIGKPSPKPKIKEGER